MCAALIVTAACGAVRSDAAPPSIDAFRAEGAVAMNQSRQSSPDVVQEVFTDLEVDGVPVRAGFRVSTQDVLAGGPLEVDFVVANSGDTPVYLTVSADRSRLRPDQFTLTAGLVEPNREFGDPMADAVYLGGPSTVVSVQPSGTYTQSLLVNQFVSLEQVPDALAASGSEAGMLWLRCQRQLRISASEDRVRAAQPMSVEGTLSLPLRTDQAALDAQIAALADQLRSDTEPTGAGDREARVTELIALRSPAALGQLESLRNHPDATVRFLVEGALNQPR